MKLFLFFIFSLFLFAHPLNLTKMDLNLSNKELKIRFVSFNLKELNLPKSPLPKDILKFKDEIFTYTKKHIIFKNCNLLPIKLNVKNEINIDQYFKLNCSDYNKLYIHFDLFFNLDSTQRGILNIYKDGNQTIKVFDKNHQDSTVLFKNEISFFEFIKYGIEHILIGYDHILFLLMLILPSFYNRFLKESLTDILKIVTAFTISHSITLSLSAFNMILPDQNLIEVLIAVTILFTAANNLFHWIFYKNEWILASIFGLIHGFGFANALKEMNLKIEDFINMVFGFNLGVEIGQIFLVAIFFIFFAKLAKKESFGRVLIYLSIIISIVLIADRVKNCW